MRQAIALIAALRRLIRPPRIVAVTRRPAGWLVVGRRRLEPIVAWARLDDGRVVGLIADRGGLRPVTGQRFHGYLPGAARSARDVQLSAPEVSVPVVDVVEAIGDAADPWTVDELGAIYGRLKLAADHEWATAALQTFIEDPTRFLRNHYALIAEHGRPAELAADVREWLASLTNKEAAGAVEEHT